MSKPLITIQILNWNRAEETLRAIDSALNQTYENIEVVVIDNGSTDKSVDLIKQYYPKVAIIELDKNYGCPDGRNRGIEHCNGEYIFYLDNDGVLHKDAVTKAFDIIKEDENIAVVAGIVYDFDNPNEINTEIEPRSIKRYEHNDFQGGICMHRKSIYDIVGTYPPHFFYGGEESNLSAKIIDKGFKIIKDESIILWHKRSDVARDRQSEQLNAYYNKLYNYMNLYPNKYAILFGIYFPFQYSRYAKSENMLGRFLKSLFSRYPKTIKHALQERKPIKMETYKKIKSL